MCLQAVESSIMVKKYLYELESAGILKRKSQLDVSDCFVIIELLTICKKITFLILAFFYLHIEGQLAYFRKFRLG